VLGSVVTDAELPADEPVADGCGSCTRCISGCPTGAIVAPGVVDAARCLAWLVQAPGSFPRELRVDLGDRLYGCDECQVVCPPNRRTADTTRPAPNPVEGEREEFVAILDLLAASDEQLLERHGRWYIANREVRYLRRNALIVLGNRGSGDDPGTVDLLRGYLGGDDTMLAAHAVWAARRLGREDLMALADASDPEITDELVHATTVRTA
jgi:epoxyqueuosine reductase